MIAFGLVYRRPAYLALGCLCFGGMAVFLLWSGQVLIIRSRGISLFVEPPVVIAALLLALLFGVAVPMQLYAFRLLSHRAAHAGATVLAALFGTASMTCCAPVLLPSLLALAGFSGTSILSINSALQQYWLPLATFSAILLSYSLISVTGTLTAVCHLRTPVGSAAGFDSTHPPKV